MATPFTRSRRGARASTPELLVPLDPKEIARILEAGLIVRARSESYRLSRAGRTALVRLLHSKAASPPSHPEADPAQEDRAGRGWGAQAAGLARPLTPCLPLPRSNAAHHAHSAPRRRPSQARRD